MSSTKRQKKKTSALWSYFKDCDDGKCAKCNFCSQVLSIKGGSTYSLLRHLKSKHLYAYQAISTSSVESDTSGPLTPKETTSSSANDNSGNISSQIESPSTSRQNQNIQHRTSSAITQYFHRPVGQKKKNDLNTLLIEAIVKNYLPFQIVESASFKKFISALNSGYELPSRKTISKVLVPQLYNIKKDEVFNNLKSCKALCLTTDGWTSAANENYVAVTAHGIDEEHKNLTFLLECYNYSENSTADNIARELKKITEKWEISEKIEAVVTDNAAYVVAAVRQTGWKHVPCFAHTLNLVVQAAISEIKDIQDKVKKIVQLFKRSPKASELLKSMQQQMGKPVLSLKQDITTRWNSTFDMFKRILEVKESLISTLAINYPNVVNLTNEDFNILEKCCEILEVFKDVTEEMSSEKNVTASKIILLSSSLKRYSVNYLNNTPDLPEGVQRLGQSLVSSLNKRFDNIEQNNTFSECTFFDPRFKRHGFTSNDTFEACKQRITSYISNFQQEPVNESNQEGIESILQTKKKSKIWEHFDTNVSKLVGSTNPKVASIIEVEQYLQEPLLLRTADPLMWWKERKSVYPRLYELAMKKLCIVGTSVPSERVFSKAGQVVTEKRSRLSGEKVNQIVFLNMNL